MKRQIEEDQALAQLPPEVRQAMLKFFTDLFNKTAVLSQAEEVKTVEAGKKAAEKTSPRKLSSKEQAMADLRKRHQELR